MKKTLAGILSILLAGVAGGAVNSQSLTSQFVAVGPIENFTIDTLGDPVSGAKMTVHGTEIVIPKNLIIQMPASYLTANDIFEINHQIDAARPANESGLALKDTFSPLAAFEATVVGNIVGNTHVAGLVWISQHSLATGAGYIKDILPSGELHLVADPNSAAPQTITRIRLNDPNSKYGPPDANPRADRRFMVDGDNPTVHAATGYPMCIPRSPNDPRCPQDNRPLGANLKPLTAFVMRDTPLPGSPAGELDIAACPGCDPNEQAPFKEGDYVLYSGTVAADAPGHYYISAHTLEANVAIYTKPGVDPAYIFIEGSLIGAQGPLVDDPRNPGKTLAQETQDRLKVEGMTTDPSRRAEVYAIDVDAAGNSILRLFETVPIQDAPFGRFRLIHGARANALFDKDGTLKGASRELMARVEKPVLTNCPGRAIDRPDLDGCPVPEAPVFANGLVAGQYVAPFGEFIFPENKVNGDPILPNNFECLPFLLLGSGPLKTNGHNGPDIGQLTPWPGPTPPTTVECGPPKI